LEGARTQQRQQVAERGNGLVARAEVAVAPGAPPFFEWTVPWKQCVELGVDALEDGLRRPLRTHAVTSFDLVAVRHPLSREHAGVRPAAVHEITEVAV